MEKWKAIKEKFICAVKQFATLNLIFGLVIFLLRVAEYLYISLLHNLPQHAWLLELRGAEYDISLLFYLAFRTLVPFMLLYLLWPGIAVVLFTVLVCLYVTADLGLVKYFATTLVPLGADLFGYKYSEIQHTVNASGGLNLYAIIVFLSFLILTVLLIHFLRYRFSRPYLHWVFYLLLGFHLFSALPPLCPENKNFTTDLEYYLENNKIGFLISKSQTYIDDKREGAEEEADAKGSESFYIDENDGNVKDFQYINPAYPFLHKEENNDVLGRFFLSSTEKPNIVIIVVEGLGSAYCGENAYLGSFTPFIDSLIGRSLYWDNFLSTGGRTFAVLPSLLGSLPFAEKGFLDMGENMPKHLSLQGLLKLNGYYTTFNYGGDSHFDGMDVFLKKQKTDFILDEKNYPAGYQKLPGKGNGFSWGYGDKELFRYAFELQVRQKRRPRLDIFLTLSTHDPFLVANQGYYLDKFENLMSQMKFSEDKKQEYRKYKQNYSCILYMDDAIKDFMSACSKLPEYANTIFIITGDHRMPEIPIRTKIDRFHVPLIIYSPMLKKGEKFSSVCSQFDLTPSLLAFLRRRYQIKIPSTSAWIAHGLDTCRRFRSIYSYPLMRNKNELLDFLNRDYFMADDQLFKLSENMEIEPVNEPEELRAAIGKFEDFKIRNNEACRNNKLIPDSLLKFIP